MKRLMSITVGALVAFTIAATTISAPAQAGKRERRIATGIFLGAAAGALIASEVSRSRHAKKRRYRDHRVRKYHRERYPRHLRDRRIRHNRYHRPRVHQRTRYSRWERHVRRCYDRYRSYDHRSDTFIGYDGIERRCRL